MPRSSLRKHLARDRVSLVPVVSLCAVFLGRGPGHRTRDLCYGPKSDSKVRKRCTRFEDLSPSWTLVSYLCGSSRSSQRLFLVRKQRPPSAFPRPVWDWGACSLPFRKGAEK